MVEPNRLRLVSRSDRGMVHFGVSHSRYLNGNKASGIYFRSELRLLFREIMGWQWFQARVSD